VILCFGIALPNAQVLAVRPLYRHCRDIPRLYHQLP
jgi:hypothetical protein